MTEPSSRYRPLLLSVSSDLWLLLVQTIALARAETRASIRATFVALAIAAVGVIAVIGGLLILLSALVLIAIALGLPAWAAASLVGLLLVAGGAGAAYVALISLQDVEFTAPRARRSLKETIGWLRTQTR